MGVTYNPYRPGRGDSVSLGDHTSRSGTLLDREGHRGTRPPTTEVIDPTRSSSLCKPLSHPLNLRKGSSRKGGRTSGRRDVSDYNIACHLRTPNNVLKTTTTPHMARHYDL